jgi:ATP-dependent Clp protease protease subunit
MKDIHDKLLQDRIIVLGTPIDEEVANRVLAQMLFLEAEDPQQDISLYINSPGGAVPASFAIYDTIAAVKPDVTTICIGRASGTAALLVARGTRGKRFATPSAQIEFAALKVAGNESPPLEQVQELLRLQNHITRAFQEVTGQPLQQIEEDMQNHLKLSAEEAVAYGIIDAIVSSPNQPK